MITLKLAWENKLNPEEEKKLLSDINTQVTLSIATFELKSEKAGSAIVIIRGMHCQISGESQSRTIIKEFTTKVNKVAFSRKLKILISN